MNCILTLIVTIYAHNSGLGFFRKPRNISNFRSLWAFRRTSTIPDCSIVCSSIVIQHEVWSDNESAKKYVLHNVTEYNEPKPSTAQLGQLEPSHFMAGFVSSRRVENHANQPVISMTYMTHESRPGLVAINAKGSKPTSRHILSEPRRQSLGHPLESSARVNLTNDQGSCRAEEEAKTSSLETAGVKRRLGMGRGTSGYTNKKFKPPWCKNVSRLGL